MAAILKRVGLVAAGLALGALAVEAATRLLLEDAYRVWPPNYRRSFEPRAAGIRGASQLTINALGMRADPFTAEQEYRALAVGGSTTICTYLDDAEAWPHVVQDDLDAALGAGRSWVGNVGRAGHTTTQHLLQVEKLLPQHPEIDAVILLVGINDLLIHLAFERAAARGERRRLNFSREEALERAFSVFPAAELGDPWYRRMGIARLWSRTRWGSLLAAGGAPRMDTRGKFVREARELRRSTSNFVDELPALDSALEGYAGRIGEIAEIARANGVRPVFLTQPTLWRDDLAREEEDRLWMGGPPLDHLEAGAAYYSAAALADGMARYNATLLRVCRERALECLDVASLLPRTTEIFWDDAHFTEEGARRLAARVADFLLAREPLRSMRAGEDARR